MTRKTMMKTLLGGAVVASTLTADNGTGIPSNGWRGSIEQTPFFGNYITTRIDLSFLGGMPQPGVVARVANAPRRTEYVEVSSGPFPVVLRIDGRDTGEPGLVHLQSFQYTPLLQGSFYYEV